jgi:hypothetical protein
MTIEMEEDAFVTTVGADGFTVRSRNNNKTGRVTFRVLNSSPLNDQLSAIYNLDALTGAGAGVFHFSELGGTSTAVSPSAWIQRAPTMERGREEGETEWVLACENLEVFVGGRVA